MLTYNQIEKIAKPFITQCGMNCEWELAIGENDIEDFTRIIEKSINDLQIKKLENVMSMVLDANSRMCEIQESIQKLNNQLENIHQKLHAIKETS